MASLFIEQTKLMTIIIDRRQRSLPRCLIIYKHKYLKLLATAGLQSCIASSIKVAT